MKRLEEVMGDLNSAYRRLEEAVKEAESPLEIDGAIQRFEITFELFWKALRWYLFSEGITCNSPRSCLKEAYKMGLIRDEPLWLQMLVDRNASVHTYDEQTSRGIFLRIKDQYIEAFRRVMEEINQRRTEYE